jgi:hypothetical protein
MSNCYLIDNDSVDLPLDPEDYPEFEDRAEVWAEEFGEGRAIGRASDEDDNDEIPL